MNSDLTSLARITKPSVPGIFKRERVFRLLDSGRKRSIVWISGPPGSGKTTLVAGYVEARGLPCLWYQMDQGDADIATFFYYLGLAAKKACPNIQKSLPLLTPEYLHGIPIFTKRYFENLCDRFKPPFAIVFDNYQDVPQGSDFHDMLVQGLDVVPEGINVIIMSRNDPPPQFARLRANSKISFIGWDELRLTMEESRDVVRTHDRGNPTDEAFEALYRKTEGWVAGLVLMTAGTAIMGTAPDALDRLAPETIFDYFANEIFGKTDSTTREFLLKTSLLPAMTARMAEKLTQNGAAEKILSQLHKNHYFTEMHSPGNPVYRYHPLFREFLLSKTTDFFDRAALSELQRDAALLLEGAGQIEHAALLLRKDEDWEGLVELALRHAQTLILQGRARTLEEWLLSIPAELVQRTPWLLYWIGVCKMPFNLRESQGFFERAFAGFKQQGDPAGLYLSWCGVVDTLIYAWSDVTFLAPWISEMEKLPQRYPYPSPEIEARVTHGMFCALMYRRPEHPDMQLWEDRVWKILLTSDDVQLRTTIGSHLILYYAWWVGDLAKAELLVRTLRPAVNSGDVAPLPFIIWRAIEAAYYWMSASVAESLQAVEDGLAAAALSGIHVWDFMLCAQGVHAALTAGNHAAAREYLTNMAKATTPDHLMNIGYYHFLAAWECLCLGEPAAALEHAQLSFHHCEEVEYPFGMAVKNYRYGEALLERGERVRGLACLAEARRIAVAMNSRTIEYVCLFCEANYFLNIKEKRPGLSSLSKAMAIGKKQGFLNHYGWRPSLMTRLLTTALEEGVEVEYAQALIRKHRLVPDEPLLEVENWPWPLKIYTLGRFQLAQDGKRVSFSGKVQKKPLELLKTLIAFGGKEVSESHLTDMLWPEAEGDAAYRAFVTTLQRLRKLLGRKEAVQLREGRLSLDLRYCWVDAWAFEHIVKKADDAWKAGELDTAVQLSRKAVALYQGPFLERDVEGPGALTLRDSLRKKFFRSLKMLCYSHEQAGEWEQAIDYYLNGLEKDGSSEEIYRSLMSCYGKTGRETELADVYRRCRRTLYATYGAEPSTETEAIYQTLKKNANVSCLPAE